MTVKKLLTLKDIPAIFDIVKSGRKNCVLSDADFRNRCMACGCPEYLLSTEITILLHYTTDFNQKMFLSTLANTGVSISIASRLTPSSFVLNTRYPYLYFSAMTVKCKEEMKITKKTSQKEYIIPLVNEDYVMQLRQLISVHTLNNTGEGKELIWAINSITASEWIHNATSRVKLDGIPICFNITPDILRRSFVICMLNLGIHPGILNRMIYMDDIIDDFNAMKILP